MRLFRSFMMGGFECSTHMLRSGRRLDLVSSTRHDVFAREDYERMQAIGMRTARDGVRWHVVEPTPGQYDFSSVTPMIQAALETGTQVIWDLLHFGWPDHIDPLSEWFPDRFADFVTGFADVLRREGDTSPAVCPVNEISFLSFAGGQLGFFNPWVHDRGDDLKRQLVRASIAAGRVMREAIPSVRLVHSDPIINVASWPERPGDRAAAENHRRAQFHAWEMLGGFACPELGGSPEHLDVLGVNYYVHNQWYFPGGHGSTISPSSPAYRPLRELLIDTYERFHRPMFIAETGIEDEARPLWLAYVGAEARAAMRAGVALEGICLYPIVNHPGWEDDRHCYNGLWDYADVSGGREPYGPLLAEIERQNELFRQFDADPSFVEDTKPALQVLDSIARSIAEATESSREA